MQKIYRRFLAMILVMLMLAAMLPMTIIAAPEALDKSELNSAIMHANNHVVVDWTADSWVPMQIAVSVAMGARNAATQTEIDAAASTLFAAIAALEPAEDAGDGYITVFISFEGYNLGHGFYIEPTAVTIPARGATAGAATIELLYNKAYDFTGTGIGDANPITGKRTATAGFYLAGVYGFNRGWKNPPAYLPNRENLHDDTEEGGWLGEFLFYPTSGWMITVDHFLITASAGAWPVSDGSVIRWQFTVYGLGADVGIYSGWGNIPPYIHNDKTQLIKALFLPGISQSSRAHALDVIIEPLSTEREINEALRAIRQDIGWAEIQPTPKPSEGTIAVSLNGKRLSFDVLPQLINGRTMVPLRAIFEALGANIMWDGATETVTATVDETVIVLTIGSIYPTVNGNAIEIDQPGITVDKRTLVPLRFVAEASGVNVQWNETTATVEITNGSN